MTKPTLPYGLTPRQFEALNLFHKLHFIKQVAEQMGVTIFTCNTFVLDAMHKMGCRSKVEAVLKWEREGLTPQPEATA